MLVVRCASSEGFRLRVGRGSVAVDGGARWQDRCLREVLQVGTMAVFDYVLVECCC